MIGDLGAKDATALAGMVAAGGGALRTGHLAPRGWIRLRNGNAAGRAWVPHVPASRHPRRIARNAAEASQPAAMAMASDMSPYQNGCSIAKR